MNAILPSLIGNAAACISCVCGDAFISPGPHTVDCVPRHDQLDAAAAVSHDEENLFGTWLPEAAEPVLLMRTQTATLIYIHSVDMCFVADPECSLPSDCPAVTTLSGVFIVEQGVPRVLIHDLVRHKGESMKGVPPLDRYRRIDHRWFQHPSQHLQWCGSLAALHSSMQSGAFRVPHPVFGLVRFTADPFRVQRVKIAGKHDG